VSDAKPVVQYVVLFGRFVVRGTLIQLHPPNEQDESLVSKVVCVKNTICFARDQHTGVYFSAVLCKDKFMQKKKNIVIFDFYKVAVIK
jgi:hypothetical protein